MPMKESDGTSQPFSLEQGTCFGFRVRSAIPFQCLRDGEGAYLDVAAPQEQTPPESLELAMEWTEHPGQPAYARLYRAQERYWLWSSVAGWTLIEPEAPRITLPLSGDPAVREEHVWTIPAALCLLHRHDLVVHAGAVEVDGQALLLVASGRAGKSTLAAAFAQAGYRVLSEDISCLRIGSQAAVVPGPAMLRLRSDVISHLTLPGSRVLRRTSSRITLALDPQQRGSCDPVPLRAVLLLEASQNGFTRERIAAAEGIRRLWSLTFQVPADNWRARCFTQLAQLAAQTPILSFARPLRLDELRTTVEYLVS